jgi:G10 protein
MHPLPQILDDYGRKMRDAENESHEGKRKSESLWPIMRISHARSRYIYELYYKREAISKELYDWLLKEKYADPKLVLVLHLYYIVLLITATVTKLDCKMEENWIRKTLLSSLYSNKGKYQRSWLHALLLRPIP